MYSLVSAKSQLKSEVANSYLNWVWWILEPLCFMLIYMLIFGVVFKAQEENFSVFIFIGITMWDFFNRITRVSVPLIRNNKGVVSKVYLPKYILLLTKVWVNGFKMLISFGIIAAMMIITKVTLTWNVLYIIPVIITLALFSFGVGTILMHLGVTFDDLSNVTNIILRVVFYLTGIFYNVSARIPAPFGQWMARVNPIAFLLESARNVLIYGRPVHLGWLALWFVVSALLSYVGIKVVYKNENNYVKVI